MTTSFAGTVSTSAFMAAMLAAGSQIGVPTAAKAATTTPQTCKVAGMELYRDPVFVSSLHPTDRNGGVREVACSVEATQTLIVGTTELRLTLGRLFNGKVGDPLLNVKLVTIETIDSKGAKDIARVLLSADPISRDMLFAPQATAAGDGVLIRISPRHRWIFRLHGGSFTAETAFGWRDGLDRTIPNGTGAGENLSIDLERMEGRIAVRANDTMPGAQPASAYGENRVIVAKLAWRNDRLVAESFETTLRKRDEEAFLDQIGELDEKVRQDLKGLPAGTEPCSLYAWSNDTDPKGLNVRAEPNAKAKVLGIVPPPRKLPPDQNEAVAGPVKAEFRIVGYRDGWFLIDEIEAPGIKYGSPYPRALPKPYKGRGWVNSRMVGAAYANGGLPSGHLFVSPHADASSSEVLDQEGELLGVGGSPTGLQACSGSWGLVQTTGGKRGWWRSFCSNQVTNCS